MIKFLFKIGDKINPELHSQVIHVKITGDKSDPTIDSYATSFFKPIVLEVVQIYKSDNERAEYLLICIDPNIGKHEWFQIKGSQATLINNKEEYPKLKLTKDDIGKEFETKNGIVYFVRLVNKVNAVIESSTGNYFTCYLDGVVTEGVNSIVKRHEPRWWLKALPDAGLLPPLSNYIACHKNGSWFTCQGYFANDGNGWVGKTGPLNPISGIIMPGLKGDEWSSSKITIDFLIEYQRLNK